MSRGDWREQMACASLEYATIFDESTRWIDSAKRICNRECKVRPQCLEWALSQPKVGGPVVLGGMTLDERERLKKARNKRRHYINSKEQS